MTQIYSKLQ